MSEERKKEINTTAYHNAMDEIARFQREKAAKLAPWGGGDE